MDKEMYESLEKLKFTWLKELCSYSEKKMDTAAFHDGKELVGAIKDLCKVMVMMQESFDPMLESSMRGSRSYRGNSFGNSMAGGYQGTSYNRGNGYGYSGHMDEFTRQLYQMMEYAPNQQAQQELLRLAKESEAGYR